MPFSNFHACRLRKPDEFEEGSFRQIVKDGVHLVIGTIKGSDTTTTQAIRYPGQSWEVAKAKADCGGKKGLLFEPAKSEQSSDLEDVAFYNGSWTGDQFDALFQGDDVKLGPPVKHEKLETEELTAVPIFSAGKWTDSAGKVREWTTGDLDQMVENAKTLADKVKPFLKLMHLGAKDHKALTAMPALGWLENFRRVGEKLLVDVRGVPKKVAELIKAGSYRRISAEIFPTFRDEATGKTHKNVVSAAGLLGAVHPAVTTLDDVMKLFGMEGSTIYTTNTIHEYNNAPGEIISFDHMDEKENKPMSITKEEAQKMIDDALDKNDKIHMESLSAERARVTKALGTEEGADLVEAAKGLRDEIDQKTKEVEDRDLREFSTAVDGMISQAKKDLKLLPRDEDGIRERVAFWQTQAEEGKVKFSKDGKSVEGSVVEKLDAHFTSLEPVPGLKFEESGKDGDPNETKKRKPTMAESAFTKELQDYAEKMGYTVDEDSARLDEEVEDVRKDSGYKLSYEQALNEVTGAEDTFVSEEAARSVRGGD